MFMNKRFIAFIVLSLFIYAHPMKRGHEEGAESRLVRRTDGLLSMNLYNGVYMGNLSMVCNALAEGADATRLFMHNQSILKIAFVRAFSMFQYKLEIIHILIDSGADVNASQHISLGHLYQPEQLLFNKTMLHLAVYLQDLSIIRHLIVAGADVNGRDSDGFSVLERAVRTGYLKGVQELIAAGAQVEDDGRYSVGADADVQNLDRVKILQEIIRAEGSSLKGSMVASDVHGMLENFKERGSDHLETDTLFMN